MKCSLVSICVEGRNRNKRHIDKVIACTTDKAHTNTCIHLHASIHKHSKTIPMKLSKIIKLFTHNQRHIVWIMDHCSI